jgi:hypothetical protein
MLMFVMTETPRFGIVLHSTPVGSALDDDDLDQSVSQSGRLVSVSPRGCRRQPAFVKLQDINPPVNSGLGLGFLRHITLLVSSQQQSPQQQHANGRAESNTQKDHLRPTNPSQSIESTHPHGTDKAIQPVTALRLARQQTGETGCLRQNVIIIPNNLRQCARTHSQSASQSVSYSQLGQASPVVWEPRSELFQVIKGWWVGSRSVHTDCAKLLLDNLAPSSSRFVSLALALRA